jgi:hypothetical protein
VGSGDPMVALQTGLLEMNLSLCSHCPKFLAEWLISCICCLSDVDLIVRAYRIVESLFVSSSLSVCRFPFPLTYEHIITFFTQFGADLQTSPSIITALVDESENETKQTNEFSSFQPFPLTNFEYLLKVMELWLYHRHHTLSRSQYIDFIGVLYRLILDPLTQNIVAQIQKCLELLFNTFPDLPLPLEQIARLIYYPNNLSLSLKCVQLTPVV